MSSMPSSKRLPRFFLSEAHASGQNIPLNNDQLHHAGRVLRLRDGQALKVWNGQGAEFTAKLHFCGTKQGHVVLTDGPYSLMHSELRCPVFVLQALPEGDKMDWILEKSTELGVQAFYPVQAQRSVVRLDETRLSKRHAHWQRVVESACLQSERGVLPQVVGCDSLTAQLNAIRTAHPDAVVMWFTPQAEQKLQSWLQTIRPLEANTALTSPWVVCVGPEGGWTAEESALAQTWGAKALRFGPRVLRTETFGLACVAQITGLLGLDAD